jgi:hypothetical protein
VLKALGLGVLMSHCSLYLINLLWLLKAAIPTGCSKFQSCADFSEPTVCQFSGEL